MSEPDSAQISSSIGDNSEDNIEDDTVAFCAATGTARQPDFTQHQGQVCHRGSQIQLESRFDPIVPRQLYLPVHLLGLDALLGSVGPVAGNVKLEDDGVMDHPIDGRAAAYWPARFHYRKAVAPLKPVNFRDH